MFVEQMVDVFREVRRVLRDDGTFWLNLGDSYANDTKWGGRTSGKHAKAQHGDTGIGRRRTNTGLKSKDRMMIPARVALALQDDGWWLRDEIVWRKANPMPMSLTDRTTPCHEMIYMLTKSARYFYDHEAIKEPAVSPHPSGNGFAGRQGTAVHMPMSGGAGTAAQWKPGGKRNRRSVWDVPIRPFKGAHFATFPPDLIEPCILAGCPIGGTVLDPFFGAGTTGLVAARTGRDCIGVELNPAYVEIAERRLGLARIGAFA